jgi:hypothetical protein
LPPAGKRSFAGNFCGSLATEWFRPPHSGVPTADIWNHTRFALRDRGAF